MTTAKFLVRLAEKRAIVSLKASPDSAFTVAERLALAEPLHIKGAIEASIWLSPGCWLLLGNRSSTDMLIDRCASKLPDILHHAVDYGDALSVIEISGPLAREVLSSGCALDLREGQFLVGMACRTRFAQIGALIVATEPENFELYVDPSYQAYLLEWLRDSGEIAAQCHANQMEKS